MKRVHRRFHLIIWLFVGPVAALGLTLALRNLPADPRADLPAAALTDGAR